MKKNVEWSNAFIINTARIINKKINYMENKFVMTNASFFIAYCTIDFYLD